MTRPLFGLHLATDGRLKRDGARCVDIDICKAGRIQSVKILSTASDADVIDLALAGYKPRDILCRLFADFKGRRVSAEDFVHWTLDDAKRLYWLGVRLFEVHNEPNLDAEGWGTSWANGGEFATWWLAVTRLLRAALPDARFGFPGLSPHGTPYPGRQDDISFAEQAVVALRAADFTCSHCYFRDSAEMRMVRGGQAWQVVRNIAPDRPHYVTEYGNPDPGVTKDAKARMYLDWHANLPTDKGIVAVYAFASTASYGFDDWRWEGSTMADIAGARPELPDNLPGGQTTRPVPEDWTHVVSGVLGLNVRAEADPNSPRVAAAMVEGQKVRVIGWNDARTWALINYPANGWSFAANLKARLQDPQPAELRVEPGPVLRLEPGARFVDVSSYQPPVEMDYPVLEFHGYSAVMVRLAVGVSEDTTWRQHVAGATAAGLGVLAYAVFSFTAGWRDQVDLLLGILRTLPGCPTVAIDLELPNPTKAAGNLKLYVSALRSAGVPLAGYTRRTWVDANLAEWGFMADLPLIAAHYRRPIGGEPWAPAGWRPTAWQHVAGEKVVPEKMYWGVAKTKAGKFIDESVVLSPWDVRTFG